MKQLISIALCLAFVRAHAQTGTPALRANMTIESEIIGYTTPAQKDALAWIKMKPAKKAVAVQQHNADVAAGKVPTSSKLAVPTVINTVEAAGGTTTCKGLARIGVTDYRLTLEFGEGGVRYLLNEGLPFAIPGKNNDTTGTWCFGVRSFPKTLEVGTFVEGYVNEMNIFPYDLKTSRKEYFNFSGGDGYSYSGFVNVRKTRTMAVNTIALSTPYYVAGTEEMEIGGHKYTAYRLLNEQWTRSETNAVVKEDPTHCFNDKYTSDKIKENLAVRGRGWDTPEKQAEILEKMQSQTGLVTNEQGYSVNMQESWYVPEFGMIVRSKYYDSSGALQMESRVVAVK